MLKLVTTTIKVSAGVILGGIAVVAFLVGALVF